MKLASIFFTASAVYIRGLPQISYKRARNMKLASIFITIKCTHVFIRKLLHHTTTLSRIPVRAAMAMP